MGFSLTIPTSKMFAPDQVFFIVLQGFLLTFVSVLPIRIGIFGHKEW
jgi:hypothetical protein